MEDKVVLQDIRKAKVFELPSYKGSKVELYDGLLFGDIRELEKVEKDEDRGIKGLVKLIKSWNFINEKKELLEITEENLNLFPAKDLTFLMNKITDLVKQQEEDKKKS